MPNLKQWSRDLRLLEITPEQNHAAMLAVCERGHDIDDRKAILEALGLIGGNS